MQMGHEKCLEIMFHSNAQIEPTLLYRDRQRDTETETETEERAGRSVGGNDPFSKIVFRRNSLSESLVFFPCWF